MNDYFSKMSKKRIKTENEYSQLPMKKVKRAYIQWKKNQENIRRKVEKEVHQKELERMREINWETISS